MRNDWFTIRIVGWTLASLFASSAAADRIVLQNGRTLDGDILREDNRTVTIEIFTSPYTMVQHVDKSQIKTWQQPSHNGAPYVVIPVFGEIGNDITADAFRAGLAKAREVHPRYIILAIDSPGGNIGHMSDMVDAVIEASRGTETIAYVKQAYSAAAVLAMCCHKVYMKPDAVIGAAVPFTMTENGPADVDAKFRSAFEAKIRASTAQGGHADLLIRGMSEPDLQIFLTTDNGKPVLRTEGPGTLIKRNGQILTLTTREATNRGLAVIAPDMADLGNQVAGGVWYESSRRPWNATVGTVALQRQQALDRLDQQRRYVARQAAIAAVKPEYEAIERRIAALLAEGTAANDAVNKLVAQCNAELQQINFEYRQALGLAQYQADPDAAAAHALEVGNARAAVARQNYQPNIASMQAVAEAAFREVSQLRARERELVASIPAE